MTYSGRAWCKWCGRRIQLVLGAWELVTRLPGAESADYMWQSYFACGKAPDHRHHPLKDSKSRLTTRKA